MQTPRTDISWLAQTLALLLHRASYKVISDQVIASPLEPITVKGRAHAVQIYELQGLK